MSEPTAQPAPWPVCAAPPTGDPAVDAALRDLAAVPEQDLDAVIRAADAVQRTLAARLSGLTDG